mmetsp:Transcript_2467/g.9796  ORF Transcript_2467/g.9796 Transcript_2467/m.9796 type:complete len:314 (-) Transcript_2467:124-1065(-)
MEEAGVQELLQVAQHAHIDEVADVVGGRLAELLAFNPRGREHLPRGVLRVGLRHDHLRQIGLHLLGEARGVVALAHVVELLEEPRGPLVEQRDNIHALDELGEVAQPQPDRPDDVQVDGDRLKDEGALHLDRHGLPGIQLALVYLSQARRGDGLGGELGVHLGNGLAELLLDALVGDLGIEGGHLVAQALQLDHGSRREQVGPDRQRLADLNVRGAQRGNDVAQLDGALHLVLLEGAAHGVQREAGHERAGHRGELHDALRDGTLARTPVRGDARRRVHQRQRVLGADVGGAAVEVEQPHVDVGARKVLLVEV